MAAAATDDVRQLQLQVDKLKERLDFMAPMLSLLNFTQDYFQKVECEASVQLMRLRNARLVAPDTASAEEKARMAPHSMETAKWLHTVTDLVMELHSGGGSAQTNRAPNTPSTSSVSAPVGQPTTSRRETAEPLRREDGTPARSALPEAPWQSLGLTPQATSPTPGSTEPRGMEFSPAWSIPASSARVSGGTGSTSASDIRSSPISGRNGPSMETTLETGGLMLGRGTWAEAYRKATGVRRDALRLLANTGIVTQRELADDLTVIDEKHVEECIGIATEMLRRWPAERGSPPEQEAKHFFEQRLTALYQRRAPSPGTGMGPGMRGNRAGGAFML